MIAKISYQPEELHIKDLNESSLINVTLSGIKENSIGRIGKILKDNQIKFSSDSDSVPAKNYFMLQEKKIDQLLKALSEGNDKDISVKIENALQNYKNYDKLLVKFGNKELSGPVIMGILNVTPDSFSDGGKFSDKNKAVDYVVEMIENGADIIDIGGESTRPGSEPVDRKEEFNRVIPVIEGILNKKPEAVISVDTTKSKIADEACRRGVKIINDISGLTFDPEIADVAAKYSASLVVMHIKETPATMQVNPVYDDLIFEIYEFLCNQTEIAKNAGVKNIIIDPGIGFGKNIVHNFEILKRLSDFKSMGYPILVGLSRKSFLGKTLNLDVDERDIASVIAETIALRNGAKIIRTHNVPNAVKAGKLFNLICK